MALILTFLGKGGTGRTTIALAAAKRYAQQGQSVLLITQPSDPTAHQVFGVAPTGDPQPVVEGLSLVQSQSTVMLERYWESLKQSESQYVRSPILQPIFGQELPILPGMDDILAMDALRKYEARGEYQVIIYDGASTQATLRMMGLPETVSWYIRRLRQIFGDSDLGRTILPFLQPLVGMIFNFDGSAENFTQPGSQFNQLVERGKVAVSDPRCFAAYLVTTGDRTSITQARTFWGMAQQVGLTVGGVLLNPLMASAPALTETDFSPLPLSTLPLKTGEDWSGLMAALPDFHQAHQAPRSITIDLAERKIRLFLPGFDKKQVKLTQNNGELTIDAGDQRRNVVLPEEFSNLSITGAKFLDSYLTISF